ncbi:oxidoreductase [Kaustia mangrovi]|uniref:Oxidoreductase n=1 Tax=Kaustia mangrovi TaxID=2593653 RepID=A0A7S8C4Y9_9HYPH|nr:oxidoreductase [Kaustia mangrovi]QPC43479.1 oxidoreductase [Kaustia mangrovi]
MPPLTDERIQEIVRAVEEHGSNRAAARALDVDPKTIRRGLKRAAERGLLSTDPVMPGYAIKSVAGKTADGKWIKQVREHGEEFRVPDGQRVKGVSALVDEDGREVIKWIKTGEDREHQLAAMRATVAALKEAIEPVAPTAPPLTVNSRLLNQYTVTDAHFGMLSWREETGADYDLEIAERLLLDWFAAAIAMAPPARTAVFAQLGDLLHYDGFEPKTPASGHILDADSRFPKVVRVVIRTVRRILSMLLQKHEHVHVVMADANHDPGSEAWLRETFAAFLEDEPRLTVKNSPAQNAEGSYYAHEHGLTSLFYHHGHKRRVGTVDSMFAGKFREIYGRTRHSYAHIGHLHSDELKSTDLMKVERHETLAAADAYGANWLSGRSAKVITYDEEFGEVSRLTLTPEMVSGAYGAANDNTKAEEAA